MSLTRTVIENPELVAIVAVAVRALVAYQRGLTYYEYLTLQRVRRVVFAALDRVGDDLGRSLVNDKRIDTMEYVATLDSSQRDVARRLRAYGFEYHLVSTIKRHHSDDGPRLSYLHFVYFHDDGAQTEVYTFQKPDGATDVFAHVETAVTDPVGHLTERQFKGDHRGVVRAALDLAEQDKRVIV